jgi:hypothetical protein
MNEEASLPIVWTKTLLKDFSGRTAVVGIRVKGNVVIATELPENPGASVTNAAERYASAICEEYGIPPKDLVWIEHYPPEMDGMPESFDRVEFEGQEEGRIGPPKWSRLSPNQVARLFE